MASLQQQQHFANGDVCGHNVLKVFTYYFTIDDSTHKVHTVINLTVPKQKISLILFTVSPQGKTAGL